MVSPPSCITLDWLAQHVVFDVFVHPFSFCNSKKEKSEVKMELEIGIFQLEDQKSFLVICKFWPITSTKDVRELSTNVKYYLKLVAQKVIQLCKYFLNFYKKM